MDRSELVTIAQRLREYAGNPHHVDPMSDAFKVLIGDAANALSQAAQPQGEPVGYVIPGDMPAQSGYTKTVNPVSEGKYTFPLYAEQPAPVAGVPEDALRLLAEASGVLQAFATQNQTARFVDVEIREYLDEMARLNNL